MPVRTHRFAATAGPPTVDIRNPAGSVTVDAVDGATEVVVTIEPLSAAAEQLLDRVDATGADTAVHVRVPERRLVRSPEFAITVTMPPDGPVSVAVASADARLRGRLGRTVVTSASGDVAVEQCSDLQARSASGDVRVGAVTGPATVGTASGDVRIDAAGGPLEVRTASGDVGIADATGNVRAKAASGDVRVERAVSGTLRLATVSGDVTVGVARGLRVWLDVQTVSGRMLSELTDETPGGAQDGDASLTLLLQSVSGDVRVHPATAPPASPAPPVPGSHLAS